VTVMRSLDDVFDELQAWRQHHLSA
jgi:hypothetical protein